MRLSPEIHHRYAAVALCVHDVLHDRFEGAQTTIFRINKNVDQPRSSLIVIAFVRIHASKANEFVVHMTDDVVWEGVGTLDSAQPVHHGGSGGMAKIRPKFTPFLEHECSGTLQELGLISQRRDLHGAPVFECDTRHGEG